MTLPEDFTLHFHPASDMPPEGQTVLIQLDGIACRGAVQYIHAWFTGEYYDDGYGWKLDSEDGPEMFEVLCWAELPPHAPFRELVDDPETKERIEGMIMASKFSPDP